MIKCLTIVGARPQFVKASVVSRQFRDSGQVREILVHTGQHYDENMSEVFFREMDILSPHYNLNIGSGPHGVQTGRMLEAIEGVIVKERPDWVLVYGDTNSTLAGSLAAVKLHVPVAHVEAGLRSFNRKMPEEINRVVTDHLATLLFAPTDAAMANLATEGIGDAAVVNSGDVMYDAALYYGEKAVRESDILNRLSLSKSSYVLATVHRAENTDNAERLEEIFLSLAELATRIPVVLPLHPRTRVTLARHGLDSTVPRGFKIVDPLGYLDMVMLEMNAAAIATDSGGVQKEAFFHGVPCVTLRAETEWVELVESGWNRLVPPGGGCSIVEAVLGAIGTRGREICPYGNGGAGVVICRGLNEFSL